MNPDIQTHPTTNKQKQAFFPKQVGVGFLKSNTVSKYDSTTGGPSTGGLAGCTRVEHLNHLSAAMQLC